MSLILGVNLLRKVFLVSDTRATSQNPSKLWVINDDMIKFFVFNAKAAAVAAGNAALACHVLRRLKESTCTDGYFSDLMEAIEQDLDEIVIDYVNMTGLENQSAVLIIAGFDKGTGKEINSTRLGDVMSAPAMRTPGKLIHQSVDTSLVKAFTEKFDQSKGLRLNEILNVEGVPKSKMVTVEVNTYRATTERYTIDSVGCYEYAVYSPPTPGRKLNVPNETIGDLEFRPQEGQKSEEILYRDAEILMSFVQQCVARYGFSTVGGHIFSQLVTQKGLIILTGTLGAIQENGTVKTVGKIFVRDGKIGYQMADGREGFYRTPENFDLRSSLELI